MVVNKYKEGFEGFSNILVKNNHDVDIKVFDKSFDDSTGD